MKRYLSVFLSSWMAVAIGSATNVSVVMNATSTTMSLTEKNSGASVDVGTPSSKTYSFNVDPGSYILTAYSGSTVNGTIQLDVTDQPDQTFTIVTCTAYASNSGWVPGTDYDFEVTVYSRDGGVVNQTPGNSTTANRKTFIATTGDSYYASFIPTQKRAEEGYQTMYKSGTLTANVNVSGSIEKGSEYTITLPQEAGLEIGMKFAHFTDFTIIDPIKTEVKGNNKEVTYMLTYNQTYNYRTWKEEGITQAGYFSIKATGENPVLNFTSADYDAYDPKQVNHDVNSNNGYETGDILVNINPQNHLSLNVGETFMAHAMRMWETSDSATANYFIEPDYHYTVLNMDGTPSTGIIEITQNLTSAWAEIKAVAKGSVIVLVTYDGICLNYYNGATKTPFLGGEYWGAIWPENTAAYVVTVGETTANITPNMVINEDYNTDALKMAGASVDSEHDVLYYLDTEDGAYYTFKPEGVAKVEIAYPAVGEQMATYTGFTTEGVSLSEDGYYTIRLINGRNIIRLTDSSGNAAYQVMRAKPCSRVISNVTRPGSRIYQPGDKVQIQYDGLFHPANKIAGIYNMSAYITYNGTPNGTSLIQGSGQYTFASAASAQAVTISIPENYNAEESPKMTLSRGVIQVNGFGDPIGSHRDISPLAGRSPNFTALAHKTYFGALPDIEFEVSAVKNFTILPVCNEAGAEIVIAKDGKTLTAAEDGTYTGTYGTYEVTASKAGYRIFRQDFSINDDAEGTQTFDITMVELGGNDWDGTSMTQPTIDENGVYLIATGSELAWFANEVNANSKSDIKGKLTSDIDLGGFNWTPIGNTNAKAYKGDFDGGSHTVSSLYINSTAGYQAFFAYLNGATISNLAVSGVVKGKQYVGGIASNAAGATTIDRCSSDVKVTATSTYAGGIVANLNAATAKVSNCYNLGNITATGNCAGVVGRNLATAQVENVFNLGTINGGTANSVGDCVGGTTAKTYVKNAYGINKYAVTDGQTLVNISQMESGEVAYKLGEAFGQEIGTDLYPVIGGEEVKYDEPSNTYYNGEFTVGVEEIESESSDIMGIYNAEGLRLNTLQHGLNIVVYTDGTSRKIIIK